MDDAPIQLEAPSKVVTTDTAVIVRARVACCDVQGRSDARSIQEILVKVAPQQLIILHGPTKVAFSFALCLFMTRQLVSNSVTSASASCTFIVYSLWRQCTPYICMQNSIGRTTCTITAPLA